MNEMEALGLVLVSIVTLGGFITIVTKFTQPINDLKLVIQKLNDIIENIKSDHENHERRLIEHGKEIDRLASKVDKIETRMDFYHKD